LLAVFTGRQERFKESYSAKATTVIASEPNSARLLYMTADYMTFFERRADVCGGEFVVKGTRVTVRTILASLAEGATSAEILGDFPTLTEEAVRAVIAFAAASAEEDLPVPPTPVPA